MYLLPDVTQPIGTLDFFAGLHNPFLAELLQLADTYFSGGMEEVPFQSSKDRIYVLSSSNSFFSKLYFDRVLKKQKESADKEKKSNPVLVRMKKKDKDTKSKTRKINFVF